MASPTDTAALSKLQCWIRQDQHRWLRRLARTKVAGSTRTRDLSRVGIQSEVIRLALDLLIRNPLLLRGVEQQREIQLIAAYSERLEQELMDTWRDQPRLEAVERLPDAERQVLKYHLGITDGHRWTFAEIATRMGFSRQRAQQIYKRGLDLLRAAAAAPDDEPQPQPAPAPVAQAVGLGGYVDFGPATLSMHDIKEGE